MQEIRWQIVLALSLIALSAFLYTLHLLLFHDLHHILIYMVGDIAFLPLEVLLVTLVIHQILEWHERSSRLEKLNMVIGTFFSSLGSDILARFAAADPQIGTLREELVVRDSWGDADFSKVCKKLQSYAFTVDTDRLDLASLKDLLNHNQEFLLRLLENPALLEHESFTELLRAITHLSEELRHRKEIASLPTSDLSHLRNDCMRAYSRLAAAWVEYMRYLKGNYPYLFSLAMRTNPFDESASPIVRD
jgi:hypothetical protein